MVQTRSVGRKRTMKVYKRKAYALRRKTPLVGGRARRPIADSMSVNMPGEATASSTGESAGQAWEEE